MSKHKLMILATVTVLAVVGLFAGNHAQQAGAATTSLDFDLPVISLEGTGASTTVNLEVTDLGIDAADTVQINIQHDAQFTISAPSCGDLYLGGSVSGAIAVTGGTAFTCALQNGPLASSGVVASFTITKNDDVTGESILSLFATGPFRTTFFEAGSEVLPGTLGTLSVWDQLDPITGDSIAENATLTPIGITSAPGTTPVLTALVDGGALPGFMTFTDHLDGTGTFEATPGFDDSGVYNVAITADNGTGSGTETFVLTVTDVNRAPTLGAIGDQSVAEDGTENVLLTASDPDGDNLVFTATVGGANVPTGFTSLTPTGAGTATLSFIPGFSDGDLDPSTYSIQVTVTDDNGGGVLDASETFTLTVTNTNQDPTVAAISDASVDEGGSIDIGISGTDLDIENITLSATIDGVSIPVGFSTISATVSDAATLTFSPAMGLVSTDTTFAVVVTASDGIGGTGQASFTLTVTNIPEINAPAGTVNLEGLNRLDATHDAQFDLIDPKVDLVLAADGASGAAVLTADVAADGSFSFSGMSEDVYLLRISAVGYFTHVLGDILADEIDLTTSDFDLSPSGDNKLVTLFGGLVIPGDDTVGGDDLSALLAAYGPATPLTDREDSLGNFVDINGDGFVTAADISILISNFVNKTGNQPWL